MKLSVLDQLPVTDGNTAVEAVAKTKELAILADQLGYHRMWLAEHHGGKTYASSAPELLIANLAAATDRIRLGTGGTMIMHYSPLKMAENFKTLSALAPGRIDFGAGRAPGGDMRASQALASGRMIQHEKLYEKLETTLDLIQDRGPVDPLYRRTLASPVNVQLPEAWLLGSSGNSAIEAGKMGIGYSFAQFFMGSMTKEIFDSYRHYFEHSYFMEKPEINVAYLVTTADTEEEAEFEAGTADVHRLMMAKGQALTFPTPESAAAIKNGLSEMDQMRIAEDRKTRHLVGTPQAIAEKIKADGAQYGFDEAMIVSLTHSQEKRLNVYRLLAKEML